MRLLQAVFTILTLLIDYLSPPRLTTLEMNSWSPLPQIFGLQISEQSR